MAQLVQHAMHLTEQNLKKLVEALQTGKNAVLQFANNHLTGDKPMQLLKTQFARVMNAIKGGKGLRLTFSPTHLKRVHKSGGFAFLAPLLSTIASFLPSLSTIASVAGPALAGGVLGGLADFGTRKIAQKISGEGLSQFGQITGSGMPKKKPPMKKSLTAGQGLYTFGQIPQRRAL